MAQGFVNGVFNKTLIYSCLQFEWVSMGCGFIWRSFLSFSLSVFTLVCFTPPLLLIFDTCSIVYTCICIYTQILVYLYM